MEKNYEKSIKVDGFKVRIGRIGKFDAAWGKRLCLENWWTPRKSFGISIFMKNRFTCLLRRGRFFVWRLLVNGFFLLNLLMSGCKIVLWTAFERPEREFILLRDFFWRWVVMILWWTFWFWFLRNIIWPLLFFLLILAASTDWKRLTPGSRILFFFIFLMVLGVYLVIIFLSVLNFLVCFVMIMFIRLLKIVMFVFGFCFS